MVEDEEVKFESEGVNEEGDNDQTENSSDPMSDVGTLRAKSCLNTDPTSEY